MIGMLIIPANTRILEKETRGEMELSPELASCSQAVPPALEELSKKQAMVQQIAQHCRRAYQDSNEPDKVFEQTKSYANDTLQNVVYHVHNVGLHVRRLCLTPPPVFLSRSRFSPSSQLTNLLEAQLSEIEGLSLQIRLLSEVTWASPPSSFHSLLTRQEISERGPAATLAVRQTGNRLSSRTTTKRALSPANSKVRFEFYVCGVNAEPTDGAPQHSP